MCYSVQRGMRWALLLSFGLSAAAEPAVSDSPFASCEPWCSDVDEHLKWCKCRACSQCAGTAVDAAARPPPPPSPPFVSRFDVYLFRGGAFNFMMANLWYAAWLEYSWYPFFAIIRHMCLINIICNRIPRSLCYVDDAETRPCCWWRPCHNS